MTKQSPIGAPQTRQSCREDLKKRKQELKQTLTSQLPDRWGAVQMNVLLSIKPVYGEAILSGAKKYEFRRTIFKRRDIEKVYIYSNSSVKKIVGSFEIGGILEGTPQEIWDTCHEYGGISKKDFFNYFEGSKRAFGIKIKNVKRFHTPINPYSTIDDFTPPQSFYYVSGAITKEWVDGQLRVVA